MLAACALRFGEIAANQEHTVSALRMLEKRQDATHDVVLRIEASVNGTPLPRPRNGNGRRSPKDVLAEVPLGVWLLLLALLGAEGVKELLAAILNSG